MSDLDPATSRRLAAAPDGVIWHGDLGWPETWRSGAVMLRVPKRSVGRCRPGFRRRDLLPCRGGSGERLKTSRTPLLPSGARHLRR